MTLPRLLLAVAGAAAAATVLAGAVRTVIVPRGEAVRLNRLAFAATRWVFECFARENRSYERRDRIMARFAPTALMILPNLWAAGVTLGFTPIYRALDEQSWTEAVLYSGSSLTTLGFRATDDTAATAVGIVEGLIGLGLVALLISFLPTMYSHFSRREQTVARLYMLAGTPTGGATPVELLLRAHRIGDLRRLDDLWTEFDRWFVEIGESHRSFPALAFFRSPDPYRAWVNAGGIALDAASLYMAALQADSDPRPPLMVRSGFVALRDLARFFEIPFDDNPTASDPISIRRDEFDAALDLLEADGAELVRDRDDAWLAFSGWRVTYEEPLLNLARHTLVPEQPWITDRSPAAHR